MISFVDTKAKTKEYFPNIKIVKSSFFPESNGQIILSFIKLSTDIQIEESLSKIIASNHTLEIQPITNRLEKIASQLETKTLHNTFLLIRELIKISKSQKLWWSTPMINVSDDFDVVLEWWNKNKSLAFYINQETIDYIKVWGADIDSEMEDGLINSVHDGSIAKLWQWISH
jgi:hypothetical protein